MESTPLEVRKGAWSEEEDLLLRRCIEKFGEGNWHQVPLKAGLNRCRKSCRLRWLNYLRPNIKRGDFTSDEVDLIIRLHKLLGNRWSLIAGRLPGRTGNDVKNYWNTHLRIKPVAGGKAQKTTAITKVIKPRPRRFSSNLVWFSGNDDTSINIVNNNNIEQSRDSLATKPSPTSPLKVDDEIGWWDNMVIDNGVLTWSMDGSDEELITSLWSDEIATGAVKASESSVQDGKNNLNDFSVDVDLSDLL